MINKKVRILIDEKVRTKLKSLANIRNMKIYEYVEMLVNEDHEKMKLELKQKIDAEMREMIYLIND